MSDKSKPVVEVDIKPPGEMRTAVYKVFDKDGNVLYTGTDKVEADKFYKTPEAVKHEKLSQALPGEVTVCSSWEEVPSELIMGLQELLPPAVFHYLWICYGPDTSFSQEERTSARQMVIKAHPEYVNRSVAGFKRGTYGQSTIIPTE